MQAWWLLSEISLGCYVLNFTLYAYYILFLLHSHVTFCSQSGTSSFTSVCHMLETTYPMLHTSCWVKLYNPKNVGLCLFPFNTLDIGLQCSLRSYHIPLGDNTGTLIHASKTLFTLNPYLNWVYGNGKLSCRGKLGVPLPHLHPHPHSPTPHPHCGWDDWD